MQSVNQSQNFIWGNILCSVVESGFVDAPIGDGYSAHIES